MADCNRREETAVAECNVREEAKVGGCRAEILACNAAAEALVGTCNTIAEAALAACKVAQAPLVELCEAAKLANNLLANIGDIGRIKGEVGATVKTDFTLADLRLRPDLSGMDGAFVVDGEANVDVTLDFQPLDVGHVLVCAFPGQATVKTRVSIPRQRVGISASSLVTTPLDDGTLAVDLMLDPDPVIAEIRPTPLQALFEQNPQLLVTCSAPVPAILAGLTAIGRATPNVLEAISAAIANPKVKALMLGEYIDDPKPTINRMKVGPITVEISGQKRQVFVRADEKSFRYEMAP